VTRWSMVTARREAFTGDSPFSTGTIGASARVTHDRRKRDPSPERASGLPSGEELRC